MRGGGVHDGRAPVTLDVDLNYHNAYLYVHRCRRALNRSLNETASAGRGLTRVRHSESGEVNIELTFQLHSCN